MDGWDINLSCYCDARTKKPATFRNWPKEALLGSGES